MKRRDLVFAVAFESAYARQPREASPEEAAAAAWIWAEEAAAAFELERLGRRPSMEGLAERQEAEIKRLRAQLAGAR